MNAVKLPSIAKCGRHGFALVATLSLLVLLVVVSVGLLSLSSIALRNSGQSEAQGEARANARLALMIAIGELQKQLGPDQRVSANGAITDILKPDGSVDVAAKNPHWTGVWNSWKAAPDDPANPTPDAASAHQTIPGSAVIPSGMSPTYTANRSDHFRSWLVSLNPDETQKIENARNLALNGVQMPDKDNDAVQLVGPGSLGSAAAAADLVSARLISVNSSTTGSAFRGRHGWWVGDESQKARLMGDSHVTNPDNTLAARLSRQQAPGSAGTRAMKGLENIANDITTEQQLAALPSLLTASLIKDATAEAPLNFHSATPFSYQVLADVREGGLKRDLSTLLERPINIAETGDDFMLYKFNDKERVPIQDLSAFFQLYRDAVVGDPAGNKGVQYSSPIANGLQITSPNFGGRGTEGLFHRQYTGLYRSPVPIKLQFLLGLNAKPRAPATITATYPATHELALTVSLALTLWNPTNLPLVMDNSATSKLFQRFRLWYLALGMKWVKPGSGWMHDVDLRRLWSSGADPIIELDISRDVPLVFAPGEVKVLSIPYDPASIINFTRFDGTNQVYQRLYEGWDPSGFMTTFKSAQVNSLAPNIFGWRLLFTPGEQIQLTINATGPATGLVSRQPIQFGLSQTSYHDSGLLSLERKYYHYTLASQDSPSGNSAFMKSFMERGFEGNAPITVDLPLATIIASSTNKETWPFLSFSLMAATETHESVNAGGIGPGGRKFASRPFLHSSAIRPSMMDADNYNAFYNYGWNWWIKPINSVLEAPVQVTADGKNGYYGGGYGAQFGSTHIVQQEIPVIPPMSLASLSHAHLGGYSLSNSVPQAPWEPTVEPSALATGKGGLFPHTLQAIGNSYAHPLLPPDKAYDTTLQRIFRIEEGAKTVVFADHSYLANKALWDEFFFSSITPQPAAVQAFGGVDRTAAAVASDFFFKDKPLPNRRITPYTRKLDQAGLDTLFTKASDFRDGLADRIAAHLMVEGPFNVNSTSVEAWKALLASLKGKPVAYLDKDAAKAGVTNPDVANTTGTPVASFTLPNAIPGPGSSDPADPDQWLGWRELSDTEIGELAEAIVRQVKLRGPFLSLSEFVNRQLDSADPGLSVKGALQAALDDPAVSINAGFRTPERQFTAAEKLTMTPAFPAALDGPVAYGSSAYVDQADILRNFAAQLTPRGDTFVIRTYGDATDTSGNVVARAWCEAVVQRVPDYSDSTADEPHEKFLDLTPVNQTFGRKFEIVSFRWLNAKEV